MQEAAKAWATVRGAGAVISTLGPTSNKPLFEVSKGMTNMVAAMRQMGVKRLIITAGAGLREEMDQPKLADKLIVTAVEAAQRQCPGRYAARSGAGQSVRAGLDSGTRANADRRPPNQHPAGRRRQGHWHTPVVLSTSPRASRWRRSTTRSG